MTKRTTKATSVERPLRAFRPDPAMDRAMLKLHETGISFSKQIKRAMSAFLAKEGVYTEKKKEKR